MQTEAIFENIAERIQQEIRQAKKTVFVAVTWFTNKVLFQELVNKSRDGCAISLLISNDKINQNSQIDFGQLTDGKSRVYKIGISNSEIIRPKFCVIDYNTIITGTYNWSENTENHSENIIITAGDTALAKQFIVEFNNIRNQYYPNEAKDDVLLPITKIITRLEILKNYIILEDIAELSKEAKKLNDYNFYVEIDEILTDINKGEFASAINKIQSFISKNLQLSIWNDPEIAALKLEIKNLENRLNTFDIEKIELEKVLFEFQHRHTIELGNIILEILRLRKFRFKTDEAKYEEAKNDEQHYRERLNTEKKKEIYELTQEEKTELKKKFRKATFLCHPDKVSNEFREAAQRIFIELKDAYDANDLKKVTEILNELENGVTFKFKSETVSEKDMLKIAISKLSRQIKVVENLISSIKKSETYKTVQSIVDWDMYFNKTKEMLQRELAELKQDEKE
jgi:hypothetical protein